MNAEKADIGQRIQIDRYIIFRSGQFAGRLFVQFRKLGISIMVAAINSFFIGANTKPIIIPNNKAVDTMSFFSRTLQSSLKKHFMASSFLFNNDLLYHRIL
nr:hypothetical protein [uncultured Clostridium sp.]